MDLLDTLLFIFSRKAAKAQRQLSNRREQRKQRICTQFRYLLFPMYLNFVVFFRALAPLRENLLVFVFEVGGAEENEAEAPQPGAVVGDALEVQAGHAAEHANCGPKGRRP
jgi:hypothetical protein